MRKDYCDLKIKIEDDFNLERIAESGQCFRWESLDNCTYRIPFREHCLIIRESGEGYYDFSCGEAEFEEVWRAYLDLDEKYGEVRAKISSEEDPFLYEACEYGKGIRILRQDPFETLISFIISQNKNIPAIRKSIEMLCQATGKKVMDPLGKEYYLFPTAEEILSLEDSVLTDCKLGYRVAYVKAAARDIADGRIVLEDLMEEGEEKTMEALTSIHGVGKKVASCMSLFGLHHIDAFPIDVWIKRILSEQYPKGYPMERYRPYNGIYQQYMFYYYRETH